MLPNKITLNIEPHFYAYLREEAGIRGFGVSALADRIIVDGFGLPSETVITGLLRDAIAAKKSADTNKPSPP